MARAPVEPRLPGPFPVGRYAHRLAEYMSERQRVRLIGEAINVKRSASGDLYFELRDADGAVPVSMWSRDTARMRLTDDAVTDGVTVVIAGGLEYYPGSATASPRLSFRASFLRPAGRGDLVDRLEALRAQLQDEGLFEPQKRLAIPALPRRIGVIAAEDGKARHDLVAALGRRGWTGTVVHSFQRVQDTKAAPEITAALRALAPVVDVIVVTRGGGSLVDLWAFCDETLCRTVASLPTPVLSAIGHTTDTPLLDDVAAAACGTPTHAAEVAVRVHAAEARSALVRQNRHLARAGTGALASHGRRLAALASVPARVLRERRAFHERIAGTVLRRKAEATLLEIERHHEVAASHGAALARGARLGIARRHADLTRAALLLRAHEPERTLERGYALVEDEQGEPLATAAETQGGMRVSIRFADGRVRARVEEQG